MQRFIFWGHPRRVATNLMAEIAADHRELIAKIEKHAKTVDYNVLDGPPRIAEMTRVMMVLSDLCLVPVGASVAELPRRNIRMEPRAHRRDQVHT